MANPNKTCSTCRFAVQATKHQLGCRRFPPQVVGETPAQFFGDAAWPLVSADAWCGEWVSYEA